MNSSVTNPDSSDHADIAGGVSPPAGLSEPAPAKALVIGELTGDRTCVSCGFNLAGQQIVREPWYGLALVRCPECSTAAALNEYPSLGRWYGRLAFLSAALYLFVLFGMYLATCGIVGGIATAINDDHIRAAARIIAQDHKKQYDAAVLAAAAGTGPTPPAIPGQLTGWEYDMISLAWWETADRSRALSAVSVTNLASSGGGWYLQLSAFSLVAAAAGVVWSVGLCGVRRRRLWLVASLLAFGTGVIIVLIRADSRTLAPFQATYAYNLAQQMAGYGSFMAIAGMLLALLFAGMLVGRTIARAVFRFVMPPRHLGLLAFVWTCDGLPPPPSLPISGRRPPAPGA